MDRLSWLLDGLTSGLPAITASLLFVALGGAAAILLGIRNWFLALATAVPVGIALLITAAELVGAIGVALPVVAYGPLALAFAVVIRISIARLRGNHAIPTSSPFSRTPALVWAGAAIGGSIALGAWLAGIGNLHVPPQANDDIWHGYLVERLTHMPSITASTVAPTLVDSPTPVVFYQYGLHLAGAFIHEMTAITVAETLNGMWTVYVGLLTPVGVAALAWRLFPDRPWVAFWSAAFSPGIALFPYVTNGILPYTASIAMGPGVLALLIAYLRRESESPGAAVAAASVGIFTTHPSGAAAIAVLAALVTAEEALGLWRRATVVLTRAAAVAAFALLWSLPWLLAARQRELGESAQAAVFALPDAIWMAIGLGSPWSPQQPIVAALAMVGVFHALRIRRAIGLCLGLGLFAALFVGIAVGARWAAEITLAWHANWYRILAVVGLIAPILAGLGTASLVQVIGRLTRKLSAGPPYRRALTLGIVPMVVVALIGIGHGAGHGQSIVRAAWNATKLVTPDDMALFDLMSTRLAPEARVLNSPRDGSGWMYALNDLTPVQPYVYARPLLLVHLLDGSGRYADPSIACRALLDLRATHAFVKKVRGDISDEEYDVGKFVRRHQQLFVEVARSPTAVAYEIDRLALDDCLAG